jgi:hypothetical protein
MTSGAEIRARARRVAAEHAPLIAITIAFIVSRLVYREGLGVTFDVLPLEYFIQYIDTWFIENDFWRSILYLHQQAPLQNVLVGSAWKYLGPDLGFAVIDALHVALGWLFAVMLYGVQRRLGVGKVAASIAAVLFVVSPFFVLIEAWLFYHHPVATILVGSLLTLLRYYRTGAPRAALLFFSLLALAAMFRNIYGATWMVATVALLLIRPPVTKLGAKHRRIILKAAAIPVLVVTLVGMKPQLLFGGGSSSAAVWANVSYRIWHALPRRERRKLKKTGDISKFIDFEPFSPVTNMPELRVPHPPTGVPLLDMATTPDGRANTFTLEYTLMTEKYARKDGQMLLSRYPKVYARAVLKDLGGWYMTPLTRDLVMHRTANRRRVLVVENAIGWLLGEDKTQRYWGYAFAFPTALLYAAWRLLRARAALASERSTVALLGFMLMTIVYVSLSTTMISYGDYSRYRFDVDSFYLVILVLLLTDLRAGLGRVVRWIRDRWRARRPAPETPLVPESRPAVTSEAT